PLALEYAVDGDPAGDAAAVALRNDVRARGRSRRRQGQRPWQRGILGLLWLGGGGQGINRRPPSGAENLVRHDFGIERLGVVDQAGTRLGEHGLAQGSAEPVHAQSRERNQPHDDQRYPDAFGKPQHQTIRSRLSVPMYALFQWLP